MARFTAVFSVLLALQSVSAQTDPRRFQPGRVFISEVAPEACLALPPANWIREIDLARGESWLFADDFDGLCTPNGLAFTPDGKRLRVLNFTGWNVLDLDSAGSAVVVYHSGDGIFAPEGQNGLAFDREGNFFVSRNGNSAILRFRNDERPGEIFGQARGGLAFSGADLLVAHGAGVVYRISPLGVRTTFDTYANSPQTIASNRAGDLFVATLGVSGENGIYRYDGANVTTRRRITDLAFLLPESGNFAMTLSPDETELYVVDWFHLWGVDVNTGAVRMLYEFPDREEFYPHGSGYGIAVYWPPALPGFVAGDMNCDGTVNQFDIVPFVEALASADGYDANHPECLYWRADVNADGSVNPFDIQAFVELLGTP